MSEAAYPSTPPRRGRRRQPKNDTPATRSLKRARTDEGDENQVPASKRSTTSAAMGAGIAPSQEPSREELAAVEGILEEFACDFDRLAVPMETRRRLAPLVKRWGPARLSQMLGLWTYLGDGSSRAVLASSLQVWGPPGTGKSAIVMDYLQSIGIRHIRLNCASFTNLGELNSRLIELLRRAGVAVAGSQIGDANLPAALQRAAPVGQQVRSLDKLETMARSPLQALSANSADGLLKDAEPADPRVKIVVVFDHAQELTRFGTNSSTAQRIDPIEFLINLPEVLQYGNQLGIVVIGRSRLGSLGLHPNREPSAVAFTPYSKEQAEDALRKVLESEQLSRQTRRGDSASSSSGMMPADVCKGLMTFAWPHLGRNLSQLLNIARQLLQEGLPEDEAGGFCADAFQQRILRAVDERVGVCDMSGLLRKGEAVNGMDAASISAMVTVRQMTKAEMRLILAAYLGGYVEKEDDIQLFMPGYKRGKARRKLGSQSDQPVQTKAPRPVSLSRLLAIYHHLARRPQLLGPPIFEHLAALREAGFLRFRAERACLDQDVMVTCRAQLRLVKQIAGELSVRLEEYLIKY